MFCLFSGTRNHHHMICMVEVITVLSGEVTAVWSLVRVIKLQYIAFVIKVVIHEQQIQIWEDNLSTVMSFLLPCTWKQTSEFNVKYYLIYTNVKFNKKSNFKFKEDEKTTGNICPFLGAGQWSGGNVLDW